eukprot:1996968-Rhodomonas_salina.1
MGHHRQISVGTKMVPRSKYWVIDTMTYTGWTSASRSRHPTPEAALDSQTWVMPINLGNTHWITAVIDWERNRIHIEDALGEERSAVVTNIITWIECETPRLTSPGNQQNIRFQ